jgi:hypothetical protein
MAKASSYRGKLPEEAKPISEDRIRAIGKIGFNLIYPFA